MTSRIRRAWALTGVGVGSRLELHEARAPDPGRGEVLVRVKAVSLNFRDVLVADGVLAADAPRPLVPTSDAAGEVVDVGEGVSRVRIGERVASHFFTSWTDGPVPPDVYTRGLGGPLPGVLATYVVLPEDAVVPAPASLSDEEVATLPIAALTAWNALNGPRPIRKGDVVVVQGTGGVSVFALQFAAKLGAEVLVTSSSDEKLVKAKALGAAGVINYGRNEAWDDAVLELTAGRGADRIIEVVGGANVNRSLRAVTGDGEIDLIGLLAGNDLAVTATSVMLKQAVIRGVAVGSRRLLEETSQAIERLGVRPVIDQAYAFEDVSSAFAHLRRGPFGKVVVRVAGA